MVEAGHAVGLLMVVLDHRHAVVRRPGGQDPVPQDDFRRPCQSPVPLGRLTMRYTPLTPSVSTLYADALGAFLAEQGLPADARATGPRLCGVSYASKMAGASRQLDDQALGLRFGA